jgi:hypothetical protein
MATKKTGPATIVASRRARQVAVAVLDALSGELGVTEAAETLGISLSRYYQLETKALAGMLAALEPRGKGPQMTPEREIKALRGEKQVLEKELRRQQTLLRAAHVRPRPHRSRRSRVQPRAGGSAAPVPRRASRGAAPASSDPRACAAAVPWPALPGPRLRSRSSAASGPGSACGPRRFADTRPEPTAPGKACGTSPSPAHEPASSFAATSS